MRKLIFLTFLLSCLVVVFPAGASVSYDLADEVIGNVEAFPLERSFVEAKLGKPDFVEEIPGFPAPLEYYIIEDSEDLSHVYLAYGALDDAQKTYAVGVVMKGIDFPTMREIISAEAGEDEETARMILLENPEFVVVDLFEQSATSPPMWVLFEEFPVQGEKRLVSSLMPSESLFSYFAAVHPEFEEVLRKAVEERAKEE
ncbi:hypothetical protein QBE54_01015 [Thermatribacter velox]|uniref:Uncharacterized protein n=1 Tax=Thermatribacter velox TaxID=3039681 RepID=A0ABZ2YF79_9BACT